MHSRLGCFDTYGKALYVGVETRIIPEVIHAEVVGRGGGHTSYGIWGPSLIIVSGI